jgi:heme o synthase
MINMKKNSWIELFKIYLNLTRSTISIVVALSGAAGYICFHKFHTSLLSLFFGVFFFSCAASVLNQYQERWQDALMERTKYRPLPDHKIKPFTALTLAALNFLAGFLLLLLTRSSIVVILGCFTIIWYNAVYTPLKEKTRFAVLPGALTGAIPPVIGWAAAGGNIFNPVISSISSFLFMWQVSHFLFLSLKYSSDYRRAGFPELFNTSSKQSYNIILFIWLLGTALCSNLLVLSGAVSGLIFPVLLCTGNIIFLFYYFYTFFIKAWNGNLQRLILLFYAYQVFILLMPVLSVL